MILSPVPRTWTRLETKKSAARSQAGYDQGPAADPVSDEDEPAASRHRGGGRAKSQAQLVREADRPQAPGADRRARGSGRRGAGPGRP